ncbi:CBN-MECR-1 protein [Aphelenchoides avenae]|nr:CBN-MECR-1 protein [Aphelenchus avenae]
MSGEESHVTRKGIRMEAFSIDAWYKRRGNAKERNQLYEELARMMKAGMLKNPTFEEHTIEDFQRAIRAAQTKSNCKQLFVFN